MINTFTVQYLILTKHVMTSISVLDRPITELTTTTK